MQIGDQIREARRQQKLNARQLADRADVCHETVYAIERGELVNVRSLRRICRALGMELQINAVPTQECA